MCSVEFKQVLFHHPAHQVGNINSVNSIAEPALEAVTIEQCHEELKIFILAIVGCCRHEQEVPSQSGEKLPQPVAFGVLDFSTKDGG